MRKLRIDELNRLSAEEFKTSVKNPVILLLDNVRSLHNVGAVFRTADAFRAQKIILCGITGTPPNREIHKTALGAEHSVEWEYTKHAHIAVKKLVEQQYQIVCIEHTDVSTSLFEFKPELQKKYCFVLGNEVFGISEEVLQEAHACIEIPQFGTKHSLNVSVVAGIILWDYVSKTNFQQLDSISS